MAKTMQERMDEMSNYLLGIEIYNDALIVRVRFPNNWRFYSSIDERIKATASDSGSDEIFYYANRNEASYDDIFDLIEETIKANEEIVLKLKLLKEKGEELRELFSTLPYEELLTLQFITSSSNKQTKSKRGRKPKNAPKKEEVSTDAQSIDSIDEERPQMYLPEVEVEMEQVIEDSDNIS